MATTCYSESIVMLYKNIGISKTGRFEFGSIYIRNITGVNYPTYFDVDSLGRMVLINSHSINIYY